MLCVLYVSRTEETVFKNNLLVAQCIFFAVSKMTLLVLTSSSALLRVNITWRCSLDSGWSSKPFLSLNQTRVSQLVCPNDVQSCVFSGSVTGRCATSIFHLC